MMELLRLSDSRVALVGGVAVDTLCVGTLVLLMLQPAAFDQGHSGVIVLVALALTAPVLASSAVVLSLVLSGRFDAEERARRTLMAATVLHGGVQLSTVLGMMCGKAPTTIPTYFIIVWLLTTALAVSFLPLSWMMRKIRKPRIVIPSDSPPAAKL